MPSPSGTRCKVGRIRTHKKKKRKERRTSEVGSCNDHDDHGDGDDDFIEHPDDDASSDFGSDGSYKETDDDDDGRNWIMDRQNPQQNHQKQATRQRKLPRRRRATSRSIIYNKDGENLQQSAGSFAAEQTSTELVTPGISARKPRRRKLPMELAFAETSSDDDDEDDDKKEESSLQLDGTNLRAVLLKPNSTARKGGDAIIEVGLQDTTTDDEEAAPVRRRPPKHRSSHAPMVAAQREKVDPIVELDLLDTTTDDDDDDEKEASTKRRQPPKRLRSHHPKVAARRKTDLQDTTTDDDDYEKEAAPGNRWPRKRLRCHPPMKAARRRRDAIAEVDLHDTTTDDDDDDNGDDHEKEASPIRQPKKRLHSHPRMAVDAAAAANNDRTATAKASSALEELSSSPPSDEDDDEDNEVAFIRSTGGGGGGLTTRCVRNGNNGCQQHIDRSGESEDGRSRALNYFYCCPVCYVECYRRLDRNIPRNAAVEDDSDDDDDDDASVVVVNDPNTGLFDDLETSHFDYGPIEILSHVDPTLQLGSAFCFGKLKYLKRHLKEDHAIDPQRDVVSNDLFHRFHASEPDGLVQRYLNRASTMKGLGYTGSYFGAVAEELKKLRGGMRQSHRWRRQLRRNPGGNTSKDTQEFGDRIATFWSTFTIRGHRIWKALQQAYSRDNKQNDTSSLGDDEEQEEEIDDGAEEAIRHDMLDRQELSPDDERSMDREFIAFIKRKHNVQDEGSSDKQEEDHDEESQEERSSENKPEQQDIVDLIDTDSDEDENDDNGSAERAS